MTAACYQRQFRQPASRFILVAALQNQHRLMPIRAEVHCPHHIRLLELPDYRRFLPQQIAGELACANPGYRPFESQDLHFMAASALAASG